MLIGDALAGNTALEVLNLADNAIGSFKVCHSMIYLRFFVVLVQLVVVVVAVVVVVVVVVGRFRDLHQPRCLPSPLPKAPLIGVRDGNYNLTYIA
jgi:hypothetical protein